MSLTTQTDDIAQALLSHHPVRGYRQDVAATPRKTPQRTIAIEDELWEPLEASAKKVGYSRPAVVKQLIRWYLGKGPLPQRPSSNDG